MSSPTGGDGSPPRSPARRRPRWGLRTLGFLGLAMLALFTSAALGGHTVGTVGSLIVGVCGAAYCSVKGVRDALRRGLWGIMVDRRPPR